MKYKFLNWEETKYIGQKRTLRKRRENTGFRQFCAQRENANAFEWGYNSFCLKPTPLHFLGNASAHTYTCIKDIIHVLKKKKKTIVLRQIFMQGIQYLFSGSWPKFSLQLPTPWNFEFFWVFFLFVQISTLSCGAINFYFFYTRHESNKYVTLVCNFNL